MTDARIIKRYANRKLYDTQHSRYVTLDQISEMIRNGDEVKIIDNKTKEDLTSVTLAQIIFEEEKKQRSFLPLTAMRNIIQNGGEQFANLVNEAQRRVTSILPRRKDGEKDDGEPRARDGEETEVAAVAEAPGAATAGEVIESGQSALEVGQDDGSVPARRGRELASLREVREWLQQSQRALDEWHKRMDDRIRGVVEGISPFAGLQKDVRTLAGRIADLESKLSKLAEHEGAMEVESRLRRPDGAAPPSGEPQTPEPS